MLFERFPVPLFQEVPQIPVELFYAEILPLLHFVEETFLEDAHSILNRTLVFRFVDLYRQDDCLVVLSPFGIIIIQYRSDPVLICGNGLLTVVSDYQHRNSAKIIQNVVVHIDPLWLLR